MKQNSRVGCHKVYGTEKPRVAGLAKKHSLRASDNKECSSWLRRPRETHGFWFCQGQSTQSTTDSLCSIASNRNPLRSMRWWKRGPGLFVAHPSAPCEIRVSFLELCFCFEPVRRGTWHQRLFSPKDMERQRVYCTMLFLLFCPSSLNSSPGPGSWLVGFGCAALWNDGRTR